MKIQAGTTVLRPLKTSETVARDIVHSVVTGGLGQGDSLPSEARMLEQYGVSRESLREGLRLLEAQVLITLRRGPGGGPVVGTVDPANLGRASTLYYHLVGATYGELFEAWAVAEGYLAERAARNEDRALVRATLEPYLGVVRSADDEFRTLVMADIPGLIEGAHQGAGLGIQFLRHVERCRALAHLVDLADPTALEGRVDTIRAELESYSASLHQRTWLLVGTKLDAVADREAALAELAAVAGSHGVGWCAISAVTGEGLERLIGMLFDLIVEREHP
jgi:hypothetical protein